MRIIDTRGKDYYDGIMFSLFHGDDLLFIQKESKTFLGSKIGSWDFFDWSWGQSLMIGLLAMILQMTINILVTTKKEALNFCLLDFVGWFILLFVKLKNANLFMVKGIFVNMRIFILREKMNLNG